MAICSDRFVILARTVASARGIPALPLVIVPHPIGGLGPEEVKAKAERAIGEVVKALTSIENAGGGGEAA